MTETMNPFYYLKTSVASFAILAGVTFSGFCVSGHSFTSTSIVSDNQVEETYSAKIEEADIQQRAGSFF